MKKWEKTNKIMNSSLQFMMWKTFSKNKTKKRMEKFHEIKVKALYSVKQPYGM